MDCMIAIEDFEELCSKKAEANRYAKDNQDKYRIMKDYSVESRVFDRVGDAAILFGMGFCLCKIGQYPLSDVELQALMVGAPGVLSELINRVLEIGARKSYKNITAAKNWYNKINEQAYYKIEEIKGQRRSEAYSKVIQRLEEGNFEFKADSALVDKEELDKRLEELEGEVAEAEEKVEVYALKEALLSEFGNQIDRRKIALEFGCSVFGAGFFSFIFDALPSLVNEVTYGSYSGAGIDYVTMASVTGAIVGAYQVQKLIKRRKVLSDFNALLGEDAVYRKDKGIYKESSVAVERMADIHLSLILHKGLMKSLNNGEGLNKEFIKTRE